MCTCKSVCVFDCLCRAFGDCPKKLSFFHFFDEMENRINERREKETDCSIEIWHRIRTFDDKFMEVHTLFNKNKFSTIRVWRCAENASFLHGVHCAHETNILNELARLYSVNIWTIPSRVYFCRWTKRETQFKRIQVDVIVSIIILLLLLTSPIHGHLICLAFHRCMFNGHSLLLLLLTNEGMSGIRLWLLSSSLINYLKTIKRKFIDCPAGWTNSKLFNGKNDQNTNECSPYGACTMYIHWRGDDGFSRRCAKVPVTAIPEWMAKKIAINSDKLRLIRTT